MEDTAEPLAILLSGGETRSRIRLPLKRDSNVSIGRSGDNTISLSNDKLVSRHHCIIQVIGRNIHVKDLDSRNGTYLDGHRIDKESPLSIPSWLKIGNTRLAIIPPQTDIDDNTVIRETIYSKEGSILITPDAAFSERSEAMMVVDIVKSTTLVKKNASLLIKIVTAMGELLERVLWKEADSYLQYTGDGFLACFNTVDNAMETAIGLGSGIRNVFDIPIQISVALHWGRATVTATGNRSGKDVHAVFSLEDLRHKEVKLANYLESWNEADLILLTEIFLRQLKPVFLKNVVTCGHYPLKGIDGKMKIFQWQMY